MSDGPSPESVSGHGAADMSSVSASSGKNSADGPINGTAAEPTSREIRSKGPSFFAKIVTLFSWPAQWVCRKEPYPWEEYDQFPPELSTRLQCTLRVSYGVAIISAAFLLDQLLLGVLPSTISGSYLAVLILPVVLVLDRAIRLPILSHDKRLEDRSDVEATFVNVDTIEPRLIEPKRSDDYDDRVQQLKSERERLEHLGAKGWTEYQVVPLNQLLVEFLKEDDLKATAKRNLAYLEDYAEDTAYRYDRKHYDHWELRIEGAIGEIDKLDGQQGSQVRDEASEPLRAELRSLLQHVADYRKDWAEGSVCIEILRLGGIAAMVSFALAALLPLAHPAAAASRSLGLLNWTLLGMSGALIAFLLDLKKSDQVEVGNTEGNKEIGRAVLGTFLGAAAALLAYAVVSGGLLEGSAVPDIDSISNKTDVGLSIVWSVASGFSFERVIDRAVGLVESGRR